tara:strand:+ start:2290 stop:10593 length:8304 start_codon:yes stop_codon:yes gene_type:complete
MRKLYDALVTNGSYTKSFEEFTKQFNNEEGSKKLHSALEKDGNYTKPYDEFVTQFEVDNKPVKTTTVDKDVPIVEEEVSITNSTSVNGSTDSVSVEGEFFIDGESLDYADPKSLIPSNFSIPPPIIDNKKSLSLDQDGNSMYGDKHETNIQRNLYQQRTYDIMHATGEYSFLKNKSLKLRKEVLDKENVPNLGRIQSEEADLNFQEMIIDLNPFQKLQQRMKAVFVPDPEIVNKLNKATENLDVSKFESEDEIADVIQENAQKILLEDPLIKQEITNINLAHIKEFDKIREELQAKYDLTDKKQHIIAVEKLNEEINKIVLEDLVKSKAFAEVAGSLDASTNEVLTEKGIAFERRNDGFLNFIDTYLKSENADDDWIPLNDTFTKIIEGAGKSVTQLRLAIKETGTSFDKGDLNDQENAIKALNNEISDLQKQQDFVLNDAFQGLDDKQKKSVEFGQDVLNEGYKVNGKKVSQDQFDEYTKLQIQLDEKMKLMDPLVKKYNEGLTKITGDVEDIEDLRKYLNAYNEANEGDGLLPDNFAGFAGAVAEQAINLGLAGAAAATKSPWIAGIAAASMFTQEYGEMYYGAAVKALEEELGRKATAEEVAKALESGEYSDVGVAAAGAGLATALEYYGLKAQFKGLKAKTKFVKSLGTIVEKGGIKKIGTNLISTALVSGEAGLVEFGTESLQKLDTQTVQGVQMADARGMRGEQGGDIFSQINFAEAAKEGKVGFWIGAGLGISAATVRQSKQEIYQIGKKIAMNFELGSMGQSFRDAEKWFQGIENKYDEAYKNRTQDNKGNWSYTEEEYQNDKESLSDIRNAGIKLPKNYSESSKKDTLDALIELESVNRQLKKLKEQGVEGLSEDLKARRDYLQKKLVRIAITEKFTQKAMKAAKGAELAQGIDIYETRAEALAAVEAWNADPANAKDQISLQEIDKKTGKLLISDGGIAESGKRVIIDLETAKEMGNVNVAAHEVLHRVLVKTFAPIDTGKVNAKGDKIYTQSKAALQIASALRTELNKIDSSILEKGSELSQRLKAYENTSESMQAEELLTLLGDVLKDGKVTLKETAIDKIGNIFRRIFQDIGWKKIKFNEGKDVVNFIKDFNYDTKRGKFSKAIKTATSEGIALGEDINALTESPDAKKPKPKRKGKSKGKNSRLINRDLVRQLQNPDIPTGEKMLIAQELVTLNKGILYPKIGFDLSKDIPTTAIDKALVAQIVGEGFTKGRNKAMFDPTKKTPYQPVSIKNGRKIGSEVMTYLGANIGFRAEEIYRNAGFRPEDMQLQRLDHPEAKEIAAVETTPSKPIKTKGKVRKTVSFENLSVVTAEFMNKVYDIVKPILKQAGNVDIQAENIIVALEEVAAKEIKKLLQQELGKVKGEKDPITGKINYVIPPTYKQFWDLEYESFKHGVSLEDIKKRYTRSTPPLFDLKKISREYIKNINTYTGKVTYPGRDVFEIKYAGKGAVGSFFTQNNRNAITRQDAVFTDIAKELASKAVYNYLAQPKNVKNITNNVDQQVAIALENEKILVAAVNLDRKAFEERSFDNFKNSKVVNDLSPKNKKYYYERYGTFLDTIRVNGSDESAVIMAMNSIYRDPDSPFSTKVFEGLENDMRQLVGRYTEAQAKYKTVTGRESNFDVEQFVTEEMLQVTEKQVIRDFLGLNFLLDKDGKKIKSLDFNNKEQLQNYSNSVILFSQGLVKKYAVKALEEKLGRKATTKEIENVLESNEYYNIGEEKAVNFVINMLGPTLTAAGKTGSGKWTFNKAGKIILNKETGRSKSLRYSIYESQEIFANVVLKQIVKPIMVNGKMVSPISMERKGKTIDKETGKPIVLKNPRILYKGKSLKKTRYPVSESGTSQFINNNYEIKGREKEAKEDADAFLEVLDWYKEQANDVNSPITKNDAGMMLMGMNGDMTTILRTAANARYIIDGKLPSKNPKNYEWEHSIPAKSILVFSADYINNGETTREDMENLMDTYHVAVIPLTMNKVINLFNKDTMRPGYKIGDNWVKRYYNWNTYGEFQYSLRDLKTNTIVPLSKAQPTAYKGVQEAKKANKKLGKNSKVINQDQTIVQQLKEFKKIDDKIIEKREYKNSRLPPLNERFNEIIEQSTGTQAIKRFSEIRAKALGARQRRWQFFIPDSAADFTGLLDVTLPSGIKGDKARKFYEDNLVNPYNRAEDMLIKDRRAITKAFKELKKQLSIVPQDLRKEAIKGFTYEQAIRVYTWTKQGMTIPGLSKRDLKDLGSIIEQNSELVTFADQLISLGKLDGYPAPTSLWLSGSISTDLRTNLNKKGRAKYLAKTGYTENVSQIFTEENLNKLEALYGSKYRKALENILMRMRTGRNRKPTGNTQEDAFLEWINNANGVTMFLNARSAVLQTTSAFNFINLGDNNIFLASKAFANNKQFWSDFAFLMNSDYLVDRREGLKLNVSESEIADAARGSTNSFRGVVNYILSKGFIFTRVADSFAIASGGAAFYRNRIKTYLKEGLSQQEAETKAFQDFKDTAEKSQQSANPSKISMEQSTTLGRLVLAYANYPMQFMRIIKREGLDLLNKRGGKGAWKGQLARITYYGALMNFVFNALQNAMFALLWEDDDEEMIDEKNARVINGMLDSVLRGLGIYGAGVAAVKDVMFKIMEENEKSRPNYENAAYEVFSLMPAIDTKVRKLRSAARTFNWNRDDMMEMGLDIDNPAFEASANLISTFTNIPIDRLLKKTKNMESVMFDEMQMWQRIARFSGWSEWDVGPQEVEQTSGDFGRIKFDRSIGRLKLNRLKL